MTPGEAAQILLDRTVADPDTGCWYWMRSLRSNGYPALQLKRRNWGGHRFAYHHLVAPLDAGREVIHHRCGVSFCVNPDHLQRATQSDNLAEMLDRRWFLARVAELEAEVLRLASVVRCVNCNDARPDTGVLP